jgi:hypothetical protein
MDDIIHQYNMSKECNAQVLTKKLLVEKEKEGRREGEGRRGCGRRQHGRVEVWCVVRRGGYVIYLLKSLRHTRSTRDTERKVHATTPHTHHTTPQSATPISSSRPLL